jgi:hypothetical protein
LALDLARRLQTLAFACEQFSDLLYATDYASNGISGAAQISANLGGDF